jgi:hypothetical protein
MGASFLTTGAEPTPCKDGVSDPAIGGGGGAIGVATLVCAATGIAFASISSAIVASRTWVIIVVRIGPVPVCALALRVDPGRSGASCHVNLTGGPLVFRSGFYHARCRCRRFRMIGEWRVLPWSTTREIPDAARLLR